MFGSHRSKKLRGETRLGYETLERRTLLAATSLNMCAEISGERVVQTPAAALTVEEWVQSLNYTQFNLLLPEHVQYLTLQQIASIPHESRLAAMSDAARAQLNMSQVRAINTELVRIRPLTATQIDWLTARQIQALSWGDFHLLSPARVPYLTPEQVATIPGAAEFGMWSEAARAALTQPQVQALNVATVYLYRLTPVQTSWLTVSQIRSLNAPDFRFLNAEQTPYLTESQIGAVQHESELLAISDDARAALTPEQVQAINTSAVRVFPLTHRQLGWLTGAQIQQLGWKDFHLIHPHRTILLTPAQLTTIPGAAEFEWWLPEARAALRYHQIQALDFQKLYLYQVTPAQRNWLTTAQIQSIHYHHFQYLSAQQIPQLTTAQLASIPHTQYLTLIPDDARAALTRAQVQALNTSVVGISPLTAQQIAWLAPAQIGQISPLEFHELPPEQVPHITTAQMALVDAPSRVQWMSDEAQAALSRAQLLALPPEIFTNVMRSHLVPPSNYHPAIHDMPGPDGLPTNPHALAEYQKVLALVPQNQATHVAVRSGLWSAPSTWSGGAVPSAGAKVVIPSGVTVNFDGMMHTAVKTLRIDGFMRFVTNANTQLKADTIVVTTSGTLHVGSEEAPIANHVTARILIADGGPIDTRWDPNVISRGLISHGAVRMHGSYVTPYVALSGSAAPGDTILRLESLPVNWKVGDELVVAGVMPQDLGTDRVRILAINGRTITITPLSYYHAAPAGHNIRIHVANLTRNVQLIAEDDSVVAERPHVMFMHNPDVDVANISVDGFGRTDKSVPINDPVVVNGALKSGTGLNARARYAIHFHHTGVNPAHAPAVITGSVVLGSPGWGFVNHQSNVTMNDNVAIDVRGASFVGEDGNEIGTMYRNLSLNATGVNLSPLARLPLHDFGFAGHGFWLQGPGIRLADNVVAGSADSAYFYMTSSSKSKFDAVNLADPTQAAGHDAVPVNAVPIAEFSRNVAYNSKIGLEIWDHLSAIDDVRSYIDQFTAWNIRYAGIDLHYSGNIAIRNATLLGYYDYHDGYGVRTNWGSQNINFENVRAEQFGVGIDVPVRGYSLISGGYFSTVKGLSIEKGQTTNRSVTIFGDITFVRPANMDQLLGQHYYEIYLNGAIDFYEFKSSYKAAIDPDEIYVARQGQQPAYLYFVEQSSSSVPFPPGLSSEVPAPYVGKTNGQLWQTYGIALNGGILPAGAFQPATYYAFAGPVTALGDFDRDGQVGAMDLSIWQQGFGVSSAGDSDADGDTDGRDFLSWQRNLGAAR